MSIGKFFLHLFSVLLEVFAELTERHVSYASLADMFSSSRGRELFSKSKMTINLALLVRHDGLGMDLLSGMGMDLLSGMGMDLLLDLRALFLADIFWIDNLK
jgi:hypothetical protein